MMEEYIFLFALAFVWIIFAIVQDFRTREVSNWLNFSLIAFVLAYRAFYAVIHKEFGFFILGVFGVLLFVGLAYALYYGRAFAGGDAKLLMGLGGILPYQGVFDVFYYGIAFVFILFLAGAIYSLIYTIYLAWKNWKPFSAEFKERFVFSKNYVIVCLVLAILLQAAIYNFDFPDFFGLLSLMIAILPVLYIYTKAVEAGCLVVWKTPGELQEGDWLEREVIVSGKKIKKSVHGLSKREIEFLKKHKTKVLIKEGIPFTPAFLIALLVGVWIWMKFFS